jgi:hypothetical protein
MGKEEARAARANVVNEPMTYASALAIALHNREPRIDLITQKIFPCRMEQFPLVGLLLYCDAVQEWSRYHPPSADLIDVGFGAEEVTFHVRFDNSKSKRKKGRGNRGLGTVL